MTRTLSFIFALLALTLPSLAQYRGIEYEIADHHPIIDSVPRAVLGPLLSEIAKPTALLAGAEQVPMVSYRASAPELVQLLRLSL